jgi:tRNA dimethylallyltransferase
MDHAMRDRGGSGRAVLIAGPTASGKSALAVRLARRLDGVVVNTDSMQVYRDLRVITARPSVDEEASAPHRLYGHVDAAENYSVGRWLADVQPVLAEIAASGRMPIFVGGTGLYFKALTRGLAAVPPIPPEIRTAVRARAERIGTAALHAELAQRDPAAAARLTPADRVRIARALEVLEATGRSLIEWHGTGTPPLLDYASTAKLFLDPDRAQLYQRIDARFAAMLAMGALDEVRALDARGLDPLLPAMKAHGVPGLRRWLRGEIPIEQAAEGGRRDTRHYAKRQLTWFRHQLPDWPWAAPEEGERTVLAQLDGGLAARATG